MRQMFNQLNSTTMKKIICKIIERVFRNETNRIKAERTAMQRMLDADRELRANGYETNRINAELHLAMSAYKHGKYERVAERIMFVTMP